MARTLTEIIRDLPPSTMLYSPRELAALLNVHVETVRRMCRTGQLPAARIGGQWRITPRTVAALLQATCAQHSQEREP